MDVLAFLDDARRRVEIELDRILPPETDPPAALHRAMRYSVLAGGKRIRPAFVLAAGRLGRAPAADLAAAAAAVELVHTYSLIHDDLPAMDDDDLRRGKPSCHVAFGEAEAILAGDALLTLAFEVLARAGQVPAELRLEAIRRLAAAAGSAGMVGGQSADLAPGAPGDDPADRLRFIHPRKTGALLGAACALGALLAGLAPGSVDRLERFGSGVGVAFQIADDLLDLAASTAELGKTAGKDARDGKLTYPTVYGADGARREALARLAQAEAEVTGLVDNLEGLAGAELLLGLGRHVLERKS